MHGSTSKAWDTRGSIFGLLLAAGGLASFPVLGDLTSPAAGSARLEMHGWIAPDRAISGDAELTTIAAGDLDRVNLKLSAGLAVQAASRISGEGTDEPLELASDAAAGWARVLLPAVVPAGSAIRLRLRFSFHGSWVDLGNDCWALDPVHSMVEIARGFAGEDAAVSVALEPPPGFEILGAERSPLLVPTKLLRADRSVGGSLVRFVAPRSTFQKASWFPQPVEGNADIRTTVSTNGGIPGGETSVRSSNQVSTTSVGALSVTVAPDWGRSVARRFEPAFLELVLMGIDAQHRDFGPIDLNGLLLVQAERLPVGHSWPWLVPVPEKEGRTPAGSLHESRLEELYFQFARHWWGHSVRPASGADQWLFDGLAELGALVGMEGSRGEEEVEKLWSARRTALLAAPSTGTSLLERVSLAEAAGAGLAEPAARERLRAQKGVLVLRELRRVMDAGQPRGAPSSFLAGLQAFAATFAGRGASTADFQRTMEAQMLVADGLPQGGSLGWFFKQWVQGTEIPRLRGQLTLRKVGDVEYQIAGTVSLSEVSSDFRLLVPLYVWLDGSREALIGLLPMTGPTDRTVGFKVKLVGKPRGLRALARYDMLARD